MLGTALEISPTRTRKKTTLVPRTQNKNKQNHKIHHKIVLRAPPKSPIFELNASSGNQWGGQYSAMMVWRAPGIGNVVARWHVLHVKLRC